MKKAISLIFIAFLSFVGSVSADTIGERHTFFVNEDYDVSGRSSIVATLIHVSDHAYFYIEDNYYNSLSSFGKQVVLEEITEAAEIFDSKIYPTQTSFWGSEPNPGIDNDPKLTILLERLKPGTGGYFDSINNYPASQASQSNQREMVVANASSISSDSLSTFLAHELQHLISFNQKEKQFGVTEEVWLNELRSQYSVSLSGLNDNFAVSDLRQRQITFIQNPTDSLTEWPNTGIDYASVTLFGQYLADRFGPGIVKDTLKFSSTGIASINEYLAKRGSDQRFSDIFRDWLWTNYINSRIIDSRFGYSNPYLQSFQVPLTNRHHLTSLAPNNFQYSAKPWQPMWNEFNIDALASASMNIKISWSNPSFRVHYADASTFPRTLKNGEIISQPTSGSRFILMPVNESKISNFSSQETPAPILLTIEYVEQPVVPEKPALKDGDLIMHAGTPDVYVIWGSYKRYLHPEVLKFYGLDAANAITVPEGVFQSYMVSNYIRVVDQKKVYAVWPDATKHWLNMTAQHFSDSHRDWNSIFIVNELEANFYKTGPDIKI